MSKIDKRRYMRVHPSIWPSFLTEMSDNEVEQNYWHLQVMA
jgi:hypothetical protein